jgi:hypothetical protein
MEKKPTRLLTNPPPCPKKKKKKKKKTTRLEPVCVCMAGRARANGHTIADVCVYRLAYSNRNFRHWLLLADTDKQQTDKQTNTPNHRQAKVT